MVGSLRAGRLQGYASSLVGLLENVTVPAPLASVVNVPVIYFSVVWWNTLHQGSSLTMGKEQHMASTMLVAMLRRR